MLGIGVMISRLGGNKETVESLQAVLGKEITSAKVVGNSLEMRFKDGSGVDLWDDGQSCCESRYMNCDDDLNFYHGAIFNDIEIKEGPSESGDWDQRDSQFLIVTTSKGQFTVANYNEHNGYYGGFAISAKPIGVNTVQPGTK